MTGPEEIVGPIVGSISTVTSSGASSTRYTPSKAQYDVAIGGLPFVLWPSDDAPYARETADFKRQQLDQSPIPGDQSLTGFWTRGQFSFHRGAGVTYYELTDGETVLNRFTNSEGVDPWTPGQVTLRPAVSSIIAMAALDVLLHDGDLIVLREDGTIHQVTYAGVATAKALTSTGTSTSITSDGVNVYAVNAGKIDKLTPGGSFTTLWTHHTGGKTFKYVWWAKSRLWAIDSDGNLFTLAGVTGGTTSAGDILWLSPYTDAAWSLAESEGSVYLSAKDTVWASTVDASTATPVLGAPVTVARVGAQETIGSLGVYLGYLIIASTAGVRIARIGDTLLLGDLVLEGDHSACSRLAYRKSLVLVSGALSASTALSELDLLEQVSDLQPAYAPMRDLGVTTDSHGAFVLPDGRVGYFTEDGIFLEGVALGDAVGSIRTGFHRFGTMELKDFRTLSVYATGTKGSIGVSLVGRDGTATSLVTLGQENFARNELALNLANLTDYIGLEFTLTAEDDVSPTLLGYQLRALPAPKRQRLIQVPLMCFDIEKVVNTTHGHRGWSSERLKALEAMEETSGAVTFQDFNFLDETATVQVEKIQFQSKTPPKDCKGSGGRIVATLRKVA